MPREQATKTFSYNLSLTLSLKVTKQPHLPFLSVIQKWMRIVACTQVPLNTFHWNCMAYQRDSVIIYHIVRCSPELLKSLKIYQDLFIGYFLCSTHNIYFTKKIGSINSGVDHSSLSKRTTWNLSYPGTSDSIRARDAHLWPPDYEALQDSASLSKNRCFHARSAWYIFKFQHNVFIVLFYMWNTLFFYT